MSGESVLNIFEQPGSDRDNKLVVGGGMETSTGANLKTKLVTVAIGDVSTAGSVWVVPGFAGTIVGISNVIDAAITGADSGLTFEIGGVAVTDAAVTITQAGSAAGDVDQSTPSALNVITAVQAVEVVKDGASTTTSNGVVTLEILVS